MIKIMLDTPVAKRSTLESRGGREQYVEESEREHDVAVELWEFVQGLVKKKQICSSLTPFVTPCIMQRVPVLQLASPDAVIDLFQNTSTDF